MRDAATDAQARLQQMMLELAGRRCHLLLSNSTADEIVALYDENQQVRRVGLRAPRVTARRAINSDPSHRGAIKEYLVTNVLTAC